NNNNNNNNDNDDSDEDRWMQLEAKLHNQSVRKKKRESARRNNRSKETAEADVVDTKEQRKLMLKLSNDSTFYYRLSTEDHDHNKDGSGGNGNSEDIHNTGKKEWEEMCRFYGFDTSRGADTLRRELYIKYSEIHKINAIWWVPSPINSMIFDHYNDVLCASDPKKALCEYNTLVIFIY
ncbi:hypothetical protein RFI_25936, partial [Reticulomyxa filosa]